MSKEFQQFTKQGRQSEQKQTTPPTQEQDNQQQEPVEKTKTYFWISLGAVIVGLILFVLSFFSDKINITNFSFYMLFSSMLLQLGAITFLNVQKKKYYFFACKVLRVASYALIIAGFLIIGGYIVLQ